METSIGMNNGNLIRNMNNDLNAEDISMLSPLQLAYIGDAVYELLVRTHLLNKKMPVKDLHKSTTKYVKAKSQSRIVHNLEDSLSGEETNIVKKGRNAKSKTIPKNAKLIDYKYATGFEALIGYLYLLQRDTRIQELLDMVWKMDLDE